MGFAASANQHVVDVFKGSDNVVGLAGWDGSDIDGVTVVVVEQEDLVVSLAGRDWKLASEVCVHFPCLRCPKLWRSNDWWHHLWARPVGMHQTGGKCQGLRGFAIKERCYVWF